MAVLINRNPVGRLICLHSLLRYLFAQFGMEEFTLNDLKYDKKKRHTITDFCPLLLKISSVRSRVCPYLKTPLSEAVCYLTQSVEYDSQKSKSASDALNALDGLGWVDRGTQSSRITSFGETIAAKDFNALGDLLLESVLSYGPFVGFLWKALANSRGAVVKRGDIFAGFPDTKEVYEEGGRKILLSTGSRKDTNVRTKSVLFCWGLSVGLFSPLSKVDIASYILEQRWTLREFKINYSEKLFSGLYVKRPLEYQWLTKSTKALRERYQGPQRETTLRLEGKVQNRRFAVVYSLAKAAEIGKGINYERLIDRLQEEKEFVINTAPFRQVMELEKEVAWLAGIPFREKGGILIPKTRIDMKIAKRGAPEKILSFLDSIMEEVILDG